MSLRNDDSALLSIDFLAGFTVFLLAFIIAASMVPGMLASLQSSTVDYDAVAYRTGVILVEDPGWFEDTGGRTGSHWQGEQDEAIRRIGLAVSKDTPGVLSMAKVDRFFNQTAYEANPGDYRDKIFFSDYPYAFNISLKKVDESNARIIGAPVPKDTTDYGSIRRVVMVKDVGPVELDSSDLNSSNSIGPKTFAVRLDFSEILNKPQAYQVDPYEDRIEVKIINLNSTSPKAKFESLGLFHGTSEIRNRFQDTRYSSLMVDGVSQSPPPSTIDVENNITLTLEPGFFTYDIVKPGETVDIKFTFNKTTTESWQYLNDIYDYSSTPSPLTRAVLEVAVW
ncbi:hypothetical protein RJ40_08405 [Methanofollis aquaemaris]|uniref:Uncharacterized protein n=1 Tax=Methanofollis aquaemaris TaxID=126734 RepID=A0A8A3S629_9EURY|nr:hypothetical protein [Methanofollis aquaemaris]QSZ67522.1 hypothetical protein RJ40_08405 [Methanofollis aquaemaris]